MASIQVEDIRGDLSFGARISGLTLGNVSDESVRQRVREVFEERGLVVFENIESSTEMQVAISEIIGPLQDHALKNVRRLDEQAMRGVIDIEYRENLYELQGRIVEGWVGWHFDACYTKRLNRGAVLRPISIPPRGGTTGFADGIQIYNAVSPQLRARCEELTMIYDEKFMIGQMRFGLPEGFRVVSLSRVWDTVMKAAEGKKRAAHPAVWTRKSGEKVLHICPWMAAGVHGYDDSEGTALFKAIWDEVEAEMTPYHHQWKLTEMVAWDNWRLIHSVSGHEPEHGRHMHRTTIEGDYGLGNFEEELAGARAL